MKVPALYYQISTKEISDEREFCLWFIRKELLGLDCLEKVQKGYFMKREGMEFVLVMSIYSFYHDGSIIEQVAAFMRDIHLMAEAEVFMRSDRIRESLNIFYDYTGELDQYRSFEESVLDS